MKQRGGTSKAQTKKKGRARMPEDKEQQPLNQLHPHSDQGYPSIEFDGDKYRSDISEFDLPDEQANQVLKALWDMMVMMVDLGWGVDSVHMLFPDLFENAGSDSGKSVKENITKKFNPAVIETLADKETKNV